ncbi:tetratricopeptide repeat protein [Pseudomonas caricapapayae]|uniref:tetratricopeptide repeat protein n=1 Tax=Pseudomonas caricapapayae TaxID=46678 RepID=UPI001CC1FD41|nr:tetratricopeptide repeat protein [Pseudomonas caricapapayae]
MHRSISRNGLCRGSVQLGIYLRYGSNNFDIDLPDALYNFTEAAQLDHPVALAELAEMHAKGLGTPVDKQKAFEYSVRSAEAGYPHGQFHLAKCYSEGLGVNPNEALAYEWLAKSAEQGHPNAMFILAHAITSGETTAFPIEDAKRYLNLCMHVPDFQNEAKVAYAKYLLEFEPGAEGMMGAASLCQECFESEDPNTELSKKSSALGRQTIQEIRKQLPNLSHSSKLIERVMIISAYYDEQGYPYKNRLKRIGMLVDLAKDHKAGKGISSHIRTMGIAHDHPKQGRNEPCACDSGKKYKQCCGK